MNWDYSLYYSGLVLLFPWATSTESKPSSEAAQSSHLHIFWNCPLHPSPFELKTLSLFFMTLNHFADQHPLLSYFQHIQAFIQLSSLSKRNYPLSFPFTISSAEVQLSRKAYLQTWSSTEQSRFHSFLCMHKRRFYLYSPVWGLHTFSAKLLILPNLTWLYMNLQYTRIA